jgi:hypothetical protein
MSLANYSELKTALADFLNRDDLTAVVPTFIALAESQLRRDLRHWRQERRVVGVADNEFEALPADFLEAINVTRSDGTQLRYYSTAALADERRINPGADGPPRFYSINSGQLEVWPPPTAAPGTESITMRYYAEIPPLTDAAPVNWLLDEMPDIYLYGSLLHSAPYLKDDTRTQVWGALYSAAVVQANRSSRIASSSGGPLVMRTR